MSEQIQIRAYNAATDDRFVYDSWLKYFYDYGTFTTGITKPIFHKFHRAIINQILGSPSGVALVAEQNDTILGYLCATPTALHWVYTKYPFRRSGVATKLLAAAGIDLNHCVYTHRTKDLAKWKFDEKFPGAIYNPYLMGA
jgi:hypothetical protein